MNEIKVIIFMKIPPFEWSKNKTESEKLAIWSTREVFHILRKVQLHKTYKLFYNFFLSLPKLPKGP